MAAIPIDADALFRAVTAESYKLLAHHLDLETGEVLTRTMQAHEVADAPQGPSVKPLPKMGGDLTPKKDAAPFGPAPVAAPAKKLFDDGDASRKPAFDSDFWKRDEKKKADPFGGGFKRESGTKKLAQIFGESAPKKKTDLSAKPAPAAGAGQAAAAVLPVGAPVDEARHPRIPVASVAQQAEWVRAFARDFGDPEIREQILNALKAGKPLASFDRVLRKHQRMSQQWDIYFRKQALAFAEAWLATLDIQWRIVEPEKRA